MFTPGVKKKKEQQVTSEELLLNLGVCLSEPTFIRRYVEFMIHPMLSDCQNIYEFVALLEQQIEVSHGHIQLTISTSGLSLLNERCLALPFAFIPEELADLLLRLCEDSGKKFFAQTITDVALSQLNANHDEKKKKGVFAKQPQKPVILYSKFRYHSTINGAQICNLIFTDVLEYICQLEATFPWELQQRLYECLERARNTW